MSLRRFVCGLPILFVTVAGAPSAGLLAQTFDRPVFDSEDGAFITVEQMMDRLAGADVVYVGETHTDLAHHRVQLAVLEALHTRNSSLVMGWEMFHSSQQPLLDAFSWGWLSEIEWLDAIYWEHTWGHPYEGYRPMLLYAHENGIRIFGLNAPRAVVRSVRTDGREAMPDSLSVWLPPGFWNRIDLPEEARYKEWFFATARHMPHASDEMMAGMFASQTAWNEIMAWNVVKAFNIIPDERLQVLVIVGSGHAVFGQGIPTRVAWRRSDLHQLVVMPQTVESVPSAAALREEGLIEEGDFIWFVPPVAGEQPPAAEAEPPIS